MAKEPFAQFFDYLITKFNAESTFVTSSDNIIIGESLDLIHKPASYFPRIEFLVGKLKFDGYIDQRNLEQSFRITLGAHIKRASDATTPDDMYNAIKLAREITKIIYSINSDKVSGIDICDGFIQIEGYSEADIEYEIFPKITSVIYFAEAQIQLMDNYSNN